VSYDSVKVVFFVIVVIALIAACFVTNSNHTSVKKKKRKKSFHCLGCLPIKIDVRMLTHSSSRKYFPKQILPNNHLPFLTYNSSHIAFKRALTVIISCSLVACLCFKLAIESDLVLYEQSRTTLDSLSVVFMVE